MGPLTNHSLTRLYEQGSCCMDINKTTPLWNNYGKDHGKWSENVLYIFYSTGQQRGRVTKWENTVTFHKHVHSPIKLININKWGKLDVIILLLITLVIRRK